jgi:N-acetyl-gamma-glutamyl-phosphate reductase
MAGTPAIRVALVGASGYTGAEALRLLYTHPQVHLARVCAHSRAGEPLADILPSFAGVDGLPPVVAFDADDVASAAQFAMLAVPHGTAQVLTAELLARGVRVVDLSADHRFDDPSFYDAVYPKPHQHPESLARTVYGIPELNRARIAQSDLVGAAGCYPTSVILASRPAVMADLLTEDAIIADCKSGVSGAGRKTGLGTHYPETSDGMRAYKTLDHRHAPEIERALGRSKVHFVPHLVPMIRGILATVYLPLKPGVDAAAVRAAYSAAYADEPFVTLLPEGKHPDTRHVRGTNRVQVGLFVQGDLLVAQAVIDNLCKGSSGQAIQCLNLMAGLPEHMGLTQTAIFP